jgi:hypothetical protein
LDGLPDEDVDGNVARLVIPKFESAGNLSENLGDLGEVFLSSRYINRFWYNVKEFRSPVLK